MHCLPLIMLVSLGLQGSPAPTAPPGTVPAAAPDPIVSSPAALLREGSYLLQVQGSIHPGEREGEWVFRVARDDPSAALYEVALLPCTLLANLEQLVASQPDETLTFELTGQVFVYRGRNYLLPTHAPRLVEYVEPANPDADGASDPEAEGPSPEAILRDLDRQVGPVARSPRADASNRPPSPRRLVAPGTLLRWRRGWMVRDPGGAWSYVFEADASGLGDPPMVLMPCMLLEELEQHAQRSSPDAPLLVSGRVYRYRGRNYLLPTMFQVPRDHTALRP